MTEVKHIQHPKRPASFCGKEGQDFAPLEALETAQSGEVCHVCLAQIVEVAARRKPAKYDAFCWMEGGQVIKESLATLWGVWAYRLMMQCLSKDAGRTIENFTYSKHQ